MSRPRSTSRVLRDIDKQEKANATESTSETQQDRSSGRSASDSAETESRTPATSTSEETDPVTDETTGGFAGEDQKEITISTKDMRDPKEYLEEIKKEIVESSTKATAIVNPPSVPLRTFAVCPRCHERRYKPEQVGTTVKCMNCRTSVVLT